MTMATRKAKWILLSAFVITAFLLASIAQVMAETWNCKSMGKMMKREGSLIPDAEGHWVGISITEGATMCDNGEIGWWTALFFWDGVKGSGSYTQYITMTLQDGSTITNVVKDKRTPGVFKYIAEIINGTGRFKGIKGTVTVEGKSLPPEKGEVVGKSVGKVIFDFSLPPK
jgi:hypothetical protein